MTHLSAADRVAHEALSCGQFQLQNPSTPNPAPFASQRHARVSGWKEQALTGARLHPSRGPLTQLAKTVGTVIAGISVLLATSLVARSESEALDPLQTGSLDKDQTDTLPLSQAPAANSNNSRSEDGIDIDALFSGLEAELESGFGSNTNDLVELEIAGLGDFRGNSPALAPEEPEINHDQGDRISGPMDLSSLLVAGPGVSDPAQWIPEIGGGFTSTGFVTAPSMTGGSASSPFVSGKASLASSTETKAPLDLTLVGTEFDEPLIGGDGNDVIFGMAGNDEIIGGKGADLIIGGEGTDLVNYSTSEMGVEVNLGTGTAKGGDAEGDQLQEIENLIGSAFDDTITGDDGINQLFGGDGDDILDGGKGKDFLSGGKGADVLIGGEGDDDVVEYVGSNTGVTVSLLDGTGSGGDADGDTLSGIEFIHGSLHDDWLEGDDKDNRLEGRTGDDDLNGEGGNDVLLGGYGADVLDGGDGIDTADYHWSDSGVNVNLETGHASGGEAEGDILHDIENLTGSDHDDVLTGDDGSNRLTGRDGDDVLSGGAGNDRLVGGEGSDTMDGGDGDRDVADYSNAKTGVGVDLMADGFMGEAKGDTYTNLEFVYGSDHNDIIYGDDANNRLVGGEGSDLLSGRNGNDYLLGGAGDDLLNGGNGADVFIFGKNAGDDIIQDFEAGAGRTDRVWLEDHHFADFGELQNALIDTAEGTLLDFGEGSILFQGITASELVVDDFIL